MILQKETAVSTDLEENEPPDWWSDDNDKDRICNVAASEEN